MRTLHLIRPRRIPSRRRLVNTISTADLQGASLRESGPPQSSALAARLQSPAPPNKKGGDLSTAALRFSLG
jgi:hypothetical protein